jgi:uncharacterized protein (DUF2336 family)
MNVQPSTSAKAEKPMILTPTDVERLLSDDSPESRALVLEKVSHHYNNKNLQGRANEIAEQIFRLLMKDVALRVRQTLSEQLKDNPDAPRDVMLHLASDVESVALPVLTQSQVLSDADLVRIVEMSHGMGKLLAISQRETVSSRVSDALVETNYQEVVASLLGNKGAAVSDRALEKIVTDFKGDEEISTALSQYPKLPSQVVEKLISQAGDAIASELKEKYNLAEAEIQQSVTQREDVMQRLLDPDLSAADVQMLVAQLVREDKLNASLVMTSLCRGQLLFFTAAVAHFSGISIDNATRLLADRGEHGFVGIYQKSGLPESMFEATRLLLRAVQDLEHDTSTPGSAYYANRLVERVLALAGTQQIEYLPYFVALIRQNVHRA